MRAPASITTAVAQNTLDTPTRPPATPASSGIEMLEALIRISRSATACARWCGGAIWCSRPITSGCTPPMDMPSSIEQAPIASAECMKGYSASAAAAMTSAPVINIHSRTRAASQGAARRTRAAVIAIEPRMAPMDDALSPRAWPISGTITPCTSQVAETNQFISSTRRTAASRHRAIALARSWAFDGGCGRSCAPRTTAQLISGPRPINRKATRKPKASIARPAQSGPTKFDAAGVNEAQEKA